VSTKRPLIAHIIHRLAVGGLENGLVNLINNLPEDRYRHAIVCLTGYSDFRKRIQRADVEVHALDKQPGKDLGVYARLWRLLRRLRPQVVHTRNLATLDCQFAAAAAGVAHRVHGEHGWDMFDLHGTSAKYRWLRRAAVPVIDCFVPMSRDLAGWLETAVGVPPRKIVQLYNGVDTLRFRPRTGRRPLDLGGVTLPEDAFVIGSVTRLEPVKNPQTTVRAFARLVRLLPEQGGRLRLLVVGDGSEKSALTQLAAEEGIAQQALFVGQRDDIDRMLQSMDLFVLTSLNEGISNTILEAMATGLPVVATAVGGNGELVTPGTTGALCASGDSDALALAMRDYLRDAELGRRHGAAARRAAEQKFSLQAMVNGYDAMYQRVMARA
jgi:sugar transferase (PEP-CTERM/EpsH1 system associated)